MIYCFFIFLRTGRGQWGMCKIAHAAKERASRNKSMRNEPDSLGSNSASFSVPAPKSPHIIDFDFNIKIHQSRPPGDEDLTTQKRPHRWLLRYSNELVTENPTRGQTKTKPERSIQASIAIQFFAEIIDRVDQPLGTARRRLFPEVNRFRQGPVQLRRTD